MGSHRGRSSKGLSGCKPSHCLPTLPACLRALDSTTRHAYAVLWLAPDYASTHLSSPNLKLKGPSGSFLFHSPVLVFSCSVTNCHKLSTLKRHSSVDWRSSIAWLGSCSGWHEPKTQVSAWLILSEGSEENFTSKFILFDRIQSLLDVRLRSPLPACLWARGHSAPGDHRNLFHMAPPSSGQQAHIKFFPCFECLTSSTSDIWFWFKGPD